MTGRQSSDSPKPPVVVTLIWCPTCGRDDRFNALRETMPHNAPSGKRCPGKTIRIRYEEATRDV